MVGEAHQGRDAVILEVVLETAGLLMPSQFEGLEAYTTQVGISPLVDGPSQPPMAEAVQPPTVVDS